MPRPNLEAVDRIAAELEAKYGKEARDAILSCSTIFITALCSRREKLSVSTSTLFRMLCQAKGWDFDQLSTEMLNLTMQALGFSEDDIEFVNFFTELTK